MTLASRIAVMDRGVVRQIGSATEIYEYPNCSFVADFIGSINMFEGEIQSMNEVAVIHVPELGVSITAQANDRMRSGQRIRVAVRPEKVHLTREAPVSGANSVQGTVEDLGYFGKDSLYRVRLGTGSKVSVNNVNAHRRAESERVAQWDDKVWLSFDPSSVILLEA